MPIDALDLATRLIACNSVTPHDGGAQGVLAEALESIGFTVTRSPGINTFGSFRTTFSVALSGSSQIVCQKWPLASAMDDMQSSSFTR